MEANRATDPLRGLQPAQPVGLAKPQRVLFRRRAVGRGNTWMRGAVMSIDPRPSAAEAGKAGGSLAEKLEELAADHNFPIDWESRWKRSTAELVRAAARLALEEVAKKFCECRPIDLLGRTSHSHDCDSAFDDVQRIAIDLGGGGQPAPLAKPLKGVDHE